MPFGAHMSISGGVAKAFARGQQVGCDAMQIFTRSERQWAARARASAAASSIRPAASRWRLTTSASASASTFHIFAAVPKIIETPKGDDMAEDIENLTLPRSLVLVPDEA